MKPAVFLVALSVLGTEQSTLPVPLIRQAKNGCGAASVAMVASYWDPRGAPDHREVYEKLIDAEGKGIELGRMKDYLENIGFRAFTLRGQWADLERQVSRGRPLIVGLRGGTKRLHFAVLTGLEPEHVWLNDPTKKKAQRVGRSKFEKQWAAADRWILLATPSARE